MEDLYALAKAEADIPDQNGRIANKLQDAQIAPPVINRHTLGSGTWTGLSNHVTRSQEIRRYSGRT